MVAWRVARSLDVLLAQLNAACPNRSKASDGSIGDVAHQKAGTSDHLPWVDIPGETANAVTARDYTHDPARGLDIGRVTDELKASRDPRIKYVIANDLIMSGAGGPKPWVWREYTGSNEHRHHFHLSVREDPRLFDDPRPWTLPMFGGAPVSVPSTPTQPANVRLLLLATPNMRGEDVKALQRKLGLTADSIFGPKTDRAVRAAQKAHGLSVDGRVGPATRRALGL